MRKASGTVKTVSAPASVRRPSRPELVPAPAGQDSHRASAPIAQIASIV